MIAYFDTSSIIPLLLGEPSSLRCTQLWNQANRVTSVRLMYPEACAALGQALRMGRLSAGALRSGTAELDDLVQQVDAIEISADLARLAGRLAQTHGLRGYDAVHLAGAVTATDPELVVVSGDRQLVAAAAAEGIATALTAVATD